MTEIQALLAKNLKATRKKLGYSQMKLAEICKISTSFIGEIEIGRKFPSPKTLQLLARALGLKPYQLFFDNEDWQNFERFKTLSNFSSALKYRLVSDIEELTTDFLSHGDSGTPIFFDTSLPVVEPPADDGTPSNDRILFEE